MRKHKGDVWILMMVGLLLMIGLVVIYAIGPLRANFMNATYGTSIEPGSFFKRQLLSVGVAVGAMVVGARVKFEWVSRMARWILVLGVVACLGLMGLAAVGSGLAKCELGACRWYNLGGMGFQPAEFLKVGLILYLAQLMARRKEEGLLERSWDFWLPFIVVSVATLFLVVVVQKDLGTGASMMAIMLAMLWAAGMSLARFGAILGALVMAGGLLIVSSPHRVQRLMTFRGGAGADTYHIDNALIAIGTGGIFGVGVGNSVQATGYLPESINDSVFAVMGETFGFLGLFLVLMLFLGLLLRLARVAERMGDLERRLVVVGVFAWLGAQVVINVSAMTGLAPLTGITLPLLSYGGTSMMFMAGMMGMAFGISQWTEREVVELGQGSFGGARRLIDGIGRGRRMR